MDLNYDIILKFLFALQKKKSQTQMLIGQIMERRSQTESLLWYDLNK